MQNIHIVTDSYAHFANSRVVEHLPVTIVPNKIVIGGSTYRENIDLNAEKALRLIDREPHAPTVIPPTVDEYVEIYRRMAHSNNAIISIHASRELSSGWDNAHRAAQHLMGNCEIVVIDSRTLCAGQAMLVQVAAKAIARKQSLDDMVQIVRSAIERIYSVYYVESIDYLLQNKLLSESHGILGMMMGIKPLLSIEEGFLRPIEKVRTRAQAVERMVEFVVEFENFEDAIILQSKPNLTEPARMLQDRLTMEFPGQQFPYGMYNASLAALIGANATGLVILEDEMDGLRDGF